MLRVLTLYLVLQFVSGFAYACDPHENCRKCLVSAFGKCKVRGNDPVCEARKAKCQKIPFEIPGDPFASGGPLGKGGPGLPGVPGEELKKCISDPQSCPGKILSAAAYQQLRAIMGNYFASLDQQASGHWRSFTDAFVRDVQPFYEVDLRAVRFATGINTGHGAAVTYGNRIYFPRQIDLNYRDDLMWMLHELEHVVQYKRRGG